MNHAMPQAETSKYIIIIHGDVPEILTSAVACRRAGRREHRIINCPFCNHPLTEVGRDTKVELYRYPARKQIRCHAYPICRACKNEIGLILV